MSNRPPGRALAAWAAAAMLVACGAPDEPPPRTTTTTTTAVAPTTTSLAPMPSATPAKPAKPATFVGTATCAPCHAAQTVAWRGSHHDLAMQQATEATVLGDFRNADAHAFRRHVHLLEA